MLEQSFYVYAGTYGGQHFCQQDTLQIVQEINLAIDKGYKKILFDNINEALYFDIIRKIHKIIDIIDRPECEFYYISAALNSEETYQRYCQDHKVEPVLKFKSAMIFEQITKGYLLNFLESTKSSERAYQIKTKSKIFCCLNKELREHRIRIFYKILKHNFLHKSYSSFYYGKQVAQTYGTNCEIQNIYKKYFKLFPLTLNAPSDRKNPIDVREGDFLYHTDSYFSLVTETLFFKDYFDAGHSVFLTEKTFRPIIHKHPFLLVAPYKSLQYLKKLGYKTFHPYIDEKYDNIENDEDRFAAIWKEVERLSTLSDEQWLNWQTKVAPIVNHNYNMIMNKNRYVLE